MKRHSSFTSPDIKRAPVAKRFGRERCHSYNAQTPKASKYTERVRLDVPKVSKLHKFKKNQIFF